MCRNQLTKGWLIVQPCSQKKESTLLRQVESQRRLPMVGPGPTGDVAGWPIQPPETACNHSKCLPVIEVVNDWSTGAPERGCKRLGLDIGLDI